MIKMKKIGIKHAIVQDATPTQIKELIESAGNLIGSVQFIKRTTGELRKMCYRLHVKSPSNAFAPKSTKVKFDGQFHRAPDGKFAVAPQKRIAERKAHDDSHQLMTVFDVNKVIHKGEEKTRGAWRTVPLDAVTKVVASGWTYDIINYK